MKFFVSVFVIVFTVCCNTTKHTAQQKQAINSGIKTGAEQTEKYLSYIKGKRVAILANQTSIVGKTHLVDSLQKLGINIVKVFGPNMVSGARRVPAIMYLMKLMRQPVFPSSPYMVQKINPPKPTWQM